MNDERIGKILDWLTERITKVEGFVIEQAPDVVQQIVTMAFALAVAGVIACFAGLLVMLAAHAFIWSKSKSLDPEDHVLRHLFPAFATGLLVFGLGASLVTVIKTTVAPKAYLLERVGVLK